MSCSCHGNIPVFFFFSASLFLRLILTLILCITSLLVSVPPSTRHRLSTLSPPFHLTLLPSPSICVFGSMKPWSLTDGLVHSGWANPVSSALSLGPFTVPHHQHNLLLLLIPLAQSRHTPHAHTETHTGVFFFFFTDLVQYSAGPFTKMKSHTERDRTSC